MDMKISTKGRYALRLMVDLAAHGGEDNPVSLRDVAGRQNLSDKYLEQIVTPLSRAGLVRSVRGPEGAISSPVTRRSTPWATFSGLWRGIWPPWSAPPMTASVTAAGTV